MCGIAGALHLSLGQIPDLNKQLNVMNQLQRHRGPDGEGIWIHPRQQVGFAHRRSLLENFSLCQRLGKAGRELVEKRCAQERMC